MRALFVHGLGRSPLSGLPLLRRLRQAGLRTESFAYLAALEDFEAIVARLKHHLARLAAGDTYIVIGHSLGGVLLRAALNALPRGTALPSHVYLLGSPVLPSRLATRLKDRWLFRTLAGDCGQLLGSPARMGAIGAVAAPTTGIAGVRGLPVSRRFFGSDLNDGVVALSEVSAAWLPGPVRMPVVHTWLPLSARVAELIVQDVLHRPTVETQA